MSDKATKLFLEVDASQIDVKQLLQKDFLELSMRAISSANPNRNQSWFTRESMERSIGSFVNKPILGYFENGDFVSHNGDWSYDSETEMSYWDTLGKKGERILGIIRESDEVKIVDDERGLSWITFTCALWTQYSFKQVKRLIKDAKRAQKTGGSTKNISVEVDITDYEMLDNGVMKINAFNLVGVTILGSRNGVKVEPGIADAELSVVDIMGRELYSAQEKSLRLAYEKLNNAGEKKEESRMENEIIDQNSEAQTDSFEGACESKVDECGGSPASLEGDVCPECGKNPCECEKATEEEGKCEKCSDETEGEDKEDDAEDDKKTDVESCKMEEQPPAGEAAETPASDEEHRDEKEEFCDCCAEEEEIDPVRDVAWLINDCTWNVESITRSVDYYSKHDIEGKEYIIAVLQRIAARQVESEKELAQLLVKLTDTITAEDMAYEAKLAQYADVNDLITKYEAAVAEKTSLTEELTAANHRIAEFEHSEFMKQANALIELAHLDEDKVTALREACENGSIASLDDLKVQVAVSAFDASHDVSAVTVTYSAPVSKPDTTTAFADKKVARAQKGDHWGTLHEYLGKE